MSQIRNVAILGSTGSIGRAALDVLSHHSDSLRLVAISCSKQLELLEQQVSAFKPRYAFALDSESHEANKWAQKNQADDGVTRRSDSHENLLRLMESQEVDTVVGGHRLEQGPEV
ncbi:MAG: hypothetical protein ACOVQM_20985, partial [Pirellula sp.]